MNKTQLFICEKNLNKTSLFSLRELNLFFQWSVVFFGVEKNVKYIFGQYLKLIYQKYDVYLYKSMDLKVDIQQKNKHSQKVLQITFMILRTVLFFFNGNKSKMEYKPYVFSF